MENMPSSVTLPDVRPWLSAWRFLDVLGHPRRRVPPKGSNVTTTPSARPRGEAWVPATPPRPYYPCCTAQLTWVCAAPPHVPTRAPSCPDMKQICRLKPPGRVGGGRGGFSEFVPPLITHRLYTSITHRLHCVLTATLTMMSLTATWSLPRSYLIIQTGFG